MVPHYPFSVECEPPYGSPSPSENLHQGRALGAARDSAAMGLRHGGDRMGSVRPTVFGLLVLIPQPVHACSCGGLLTSCGRTWSAGETMFLGETTSLEKLGQPGPGPPVSYAVHFTVEESYRGRGVPGSEIVVDTGFGGSGFSHWIRPAARAANR